MPTQTNWPPENGDITHLIERLDALEERMSVRFEALSARVFLNLFGVPMLKVCGEVHAREGLEITHRLKVVTTIYDAQGKILEIGNHFFVPERFYGFEAFWDHFATDVPVAKIRVYPQLTD